MPRETFLILAKRAFLEIHADERLQTRILLCVLCVSVVNLAA